MTSHCKGNGVTNRIFLARLMLFTVCGPQVGPLVDTLIYCKLVKCPTFFKEPCPLPINNVARVPLLNVLFPKRANRWMDHGDGVPVNLKIGRW